MDRVPLVLATHCTELCLALAATCRSLHGFSVERVSSIVLGGSSRASTLRLLLPSDGGAEDAEGRQEGAEDGEGRHEGAAQGPVEESTLYLQRCLAIVTAASCRPDPPPLHSPPFSLCSPHLANAAVSQISVGVSHVVFTVRCGKVFAFGDARDGRLGFAAGSDGRWQSSPREIILDVGGFTGCFVRMSC